MIHDRLVHSIETQTKVLVFKTTYLLSNIAPVLFDVKAKREDRRKKTRRSVRTRRVSGVRNDD